MHTIILILEIVLLVVVYKTILAHGILKWWFRFGLHFENRFFYPAIWGCGACISGQASFWIYVISWFVVKKDGTSRKIDFLLETIPIYHPDHFSVFYMALFCSATILITTLTINTLQKWI